jgi:hypothetical protein
MNISVLKHSVIKSPRFISRVRSSLHPKRTDQSLPLTNGCMMLESTKSYLKWKGKFLCYNYEDSDLLRYRDQVICVAIGNQGLEPTIGEGRDAFIQIQQLTQRLYHMSTSKPEPNIVLLWNPPTGFSEGLADIVNAAYPENRVVNDYEARAGLAILNEGLEAAALDRGHEVRVCRASPKLLLRMLRIAKEPINLDTVSVMLQKIHSMRGSEVSVTDEEVLEMDKDFG